MAVRTLQLKTKLLLGFAFLAAVVTGVAGQGLMAASRANDRFSAYLEGIAQRERLATDIQAAATKRAIAARNVVLVDAAEREAELRLVLQAQDEVQGSLKRLQGVVQPSDSHGKERQLLSELGKVEAEYSTLVLAIGKLVGDNQRDAAVAKMNRECRPLLRQLLALTGELVQHYHHQAAQEQAAAGRNSSTDRTVIAAVSALAVAIAVALGWWLANAVTRPLSRAVGFAQAVAAGDLSSDIQVDTFDETGALLQSLKDMNGNLLDMVLRVRESADGIAVASAQIAAGNQDLSNRTEQQASALQETASSMQEITTMVRQNVASAEQASEAASMAYEVASRGGQAVGRVVATMTDIAGASQQIAEITGVIDGIAFQTNILALNAAVEAARAGEQGRGFAVVAGEVRTLAQRSAEAAKQIKGLIGNSTEKVAVGSRLVNEAGTTMQEVVAQVQRMTAFISEIKTATAAQGGGILQVNDAVASIDQGTQQNAALVEQSAAAADSLKQQAAGLLTAIAVFTTQQQAPLRNHALTA